MHPAACMARSIAPLPPHRRMRSQCLVPVMLIADPRHLHRTRSLRSRRWPATRSTSMPSRRPARRQAQPVLRIHPLFGKQPRFRKGLVVQMMRLVEDQERILPQFGHQLRYGTSDIAPLAADRLVISGIKSPVKFRLVCDPDGIRAVVGKFVVRSASFTGSADAFRRDVHLGGRASMSRQWWRLLDRSPGRHRMTCLPCEIPGTGLWPNRSIPLAVKPVHSDLATLRRPPPPSDFRRNCGSALTLNPGESRGPHSPCFPS